MTQLNTPYPPPPTSPAFCARAAWTRGRWTWRWAGAAAVSPAGLTELHTAAKAVDTPQAQWFCAEFERILAVTPRVIAFLQGRDATLAHRINTRAFLPEGALCGAGPPYVHDEDEGGDPLAWAFGALGLQDRARHYATLFLNDLADVLREAVDERFEFVRYAEKLARRAGPLRPLAEALAREPHSSTARWQLLTDGEALAAHTPDVVLLSVPFPGSVSRGAAHRPTDQGLRAADHRRARRRLCEHRAARTQRAAPL